MGARDIFFRFFVLLAISLNLEIVTALMHVSFFCSNFLILERLFLYLSNITGRV